MNEQTSEPPVQPDYEHTHTPEGVAPAIQKVRALETQATLLLDELYPDPNSPKDSIGNALELARESFRIALYHLSLVEQQAQDPNQGNPTT